MAPDDIELAQSEILQKIRARTPARLFVGRSGAAPRTVTQLELRAAHAAAIDSVDTELDLQRDLGSEITGQYSVFEVQTLAKSKAEYLRDPDLGRHLNDAGRELIRNGCPAGTDLQIAIGDGLSVAAVAAQVPTLLPPLMSKSLQSGWSIGQPFVIRYCRVGVMNEIGELLRPKVVLLLIGERPGLATAESLSAYMAFQPKAGHTDADRNLISNIHARGVPVDVAAHRIIDFAAQLMRAGRSGSGVKEDLRSTAHAQGQQLGD
jgi:ethanolamine ammonia-lyase small subunit